MKKHIVNMTEGNMMKQIAGFTIPIIFSGILQVLYNAADMAVVGKFSGDTALAAVGSAGPAINIFINIFLGIATAANIIVAQKFGANDKEGVSRAVHTSVASSLIFGATLAILGIVFSGKLLDLMGCPQNVINLSTLYMQIYFAGIPAMMLFNFGAAILRAVGNSKHPTIFLIISGIINVILNFIFVVAFEMHVAGVALATVIAQMISAILVLICLTKNNESVKLNMRKIKLHGMELKKLIFLGIPSGIQSTCIALSNVIVQSSVNSCGSTAMAASSAANSIEGIVYISLYAFSQTAITFTSQNYGSGKFDRIKKGFYVNLLSVLIFGFAFSQLILRLSPRLLAFYTDSETVIFFAKERLNIICFTYFLCGISEVAGGALRGLGAISKTVWTTLLGECGVRILMRFIGAPYNEIEDLNFLFYSFPASWLVMGIMLVALFFRQLKIQQKIRKDDLYEP